MIRSTFPLVLVGVAALLTTACDKTREALGLERNRPDEFTVQPSQSLVVPPNMRDLPTPKPGAPRPYETMPRDKARTAVMSSVTRRERVDTSDKSKGEIAFLEKARALEERSENIRDVVNEEARVEGQHEESFIKKLLSIDPEQSGKVLDPHEESKRLTGKEHPGDQVVAPKGQEISS